MRAGRGAGRGDRRGEHGADGRAAPQEAEEPCGSPERPGQEEGANDGAGAAGGGAGGGGEGRGLRAGIGGCCGLPAHGCLQNQKLLLENQLLRERTCNLALENQELRCRLGLDVLKTEEESESQVSLVSSSSAGPAGAAPLRGGCVAVGGERPPGALGLQRLSCHGETSCAGDALTLSRGFPAVSRYRV